MIKIELDLDYATYSAHIRETTNMIEKQFNDPEKFILDLPDSLKNDEKKGIAMKYREAIMYHLTDNFKELVNNRDNKYRNGDLWLLGDSIEIEKKVKEDLYRELTGEALNE